MLKKLLYTALCLILLLPVSCRRDWLEEGVDTVDIPEGVPITVLLPFSSVEQYDVTVGTRAESPVTDESRIHNLYVMIFDNTKLVDDDNYSSSPKKIYGRYFSYDHLKDKPSDLNSDDNECWFVKNKPLNSDDEVLTQGAVKISTVTCSDATVVVIANVTNAVSNLDGINGLDRLKAVQHYKELKDIQVCLEQDIVNRKDLFLMTGELANKNTRNLMWNTAVGNEIYNSTYRVSLTHVDAKVKFRVKVNRNNISAVKPVYWQVCNTPDRCYLYTKPDGSAPEGIDHFASQQYYFEGTDYDKDPSTKEILKEWDPTTQEMVPITYYTFCFYMLENNQSPNGFATKYYQRELRDKIDSGVPGYKGKTGPESGAFGTHYVENGDWKYAPTFGTYVRFDLVLTLTDAGIAEVGDVDTGQLTITQALTSDAIFTVHLGDFGNSGDRTIKDGTAIAGSQFNDYETKRGHSYTYNITINNTTNIYAEVINDVEVQSGQEGFLLLTDTEIINADCHYEYHQISFDYRQGLDQDKFSWYVKTPFGEGGPEITKNLVTGEYTYNADGLDYKWVLFGLNDVVKAPGDVGYVAPSGSEEEPDPEAWYNYTTGQTVRPYSKRRHAYPGDTHYDPSWKPGVQVAAGVPVNGGPSNPSDPEYRMVPDLMDITQLIEYIFDQTNKEDATPGSSSFILDSSVSMVPVLRFTAFIDEYYYVKDPTRPDAPLDRDLWRKFVNANPRELHILSDAESSRDRKSDVILSSHSVIQQSIQTIYNIYSADLRSLWGTEHTDEMKVISKGWPYWQDGGQNSGRAGEFKTVNGKENGRLNSAYIWEFVSITKDSGGNFQYASMTDKTAPGYSNPPQWTKYLDYNVHNNTPMLKEDYYGMAWSCMTRNRDNDGDGKVDRDEVRWYLAAPNQLIGMWVGNESLSVNARLYRPEKNQWRAHILSSADRRVCWAEEGGGATEYRYESDPETWDGFFKAAEGESVRCLRNIGTYDVAGVPTDITGAEYMERPQRYFTITPEPDENLTLEDSPDIHYTFSYDRINPKSLREFTDAELPYNDQFSINNCVYLKMETQSRTDEKKLLGVDGESDAYPNHPYPYNLRLNELNIELDSLGYNPYCPPGYRFPGQVEMLLMSVYLPESYFVKNWSGDAYNDKWFMPTRTYYDRGLFGKNTEGFEYDRQSKTEATEREQHKVGWGYSINRKKNTTARGNINDQKMRISRCVRDVNMTGTIEGGLLLKDVLYPGDNVPISFSFYSSGSAFISASLKFCYTDGSGVYHERDYPVQTTPSGLQFLEDQTVKLPTISEMGLVGKSLSAAKPKFKITMRNAYISKTFEQTVTLGNPLSGSFTLVGNNELIPGENKGMNFDIVSQANTCHLTDATLLLKYKNTYDSNASNTLVIPGVNVQTLAYVHMNEAVAIPATGGGSGQLDLLDSDLPQKNVTLELTVTDSGGSSETFTIETVNGKALQLGTSPAFDGFRIKAKDDDTEVHLYYTDGSISYSTDAGENWYPYTGQTIELDADEFVCLQGTRTDCSLIGNNQLFTTNGKLCYIAGQIASLLGYPVTLPANAFRSAFSAYGTAAGSENSPSAVSNPTQVTWVDIDPLAPLILPSSTGANCYMEMFMGCSSLTHAPDLPATTLADKCYFRMFHSCTGLTSIPTFPSTAVTWSGTNRYCYQMFQSCTGITTLTGSLFSGTTTLGTGCFEDMFAHCTGLTSVSTALLPATTLAANCYRGMFQDTRFARAPDLLATTLVSECYRYMFNACSKLNYVKCLATTNIGNGFTTNWLKDVANQSTCTFEKDASTTTWPRNANGIPTNWNVVNYTP